MNNDECKKKARAYEKPRLRVIDLASEEVLSIGCKTAIAPAFGGPGCNTLPCVAVGT